MTVRSRWTLPGLSAALTLVAALLVLLIATPPSDDAPTAAPERIDQTDRQAMKRARWEYFFRLQRDPATNRIPDHIRARELDYAQTLPARDLTAKSGSGPAYTWAEAGPHDVGGRTRALGVDRRNPNVLIAGGVSGGIWKSVDGGASWSLRTAPDQRLSVTSLAQDPTQPDTWYYATGEIRGNSASDRGFTAPFRGRGIYKSTDNGDTWQVLEPTFVNDPTTYNSPFQYVPRIVVSPATGTVLAATNAGGIHRSADGGASFNRVLDDPSDPYWSEVAVASDGTFLAVLSARGLSEPVDGAGVYLSTDDGRSWSDVTPPGFPGYHRRSVAAFAPSNPNVAYLLSTVGRNPDSYPSASLFRMERAGNTVTATDRSAHLPSFGGTTGNFMTQFDYNLMISVKPDDPNTVVIGGRNLWRSDDGFQSDPDWIGGYARGGQSYGRYPNHHPDQHVAVFDPSNPSRMWSGNDGGVYLTTNIGAESVEWIDRNNGYNVTQFYTVSLPETADDPRIAGGTQDNGTPFFRVSDSAPSSVDISGADGSHLYFGETYAFTSSQYGYVRRLPYNSTQQPYFGIGAARVDPRQAEDQLFVHPFAVDPNDESVMYYPAGADLWRSTTLDAARPDWERIGTLPALGNCRITTLRPSTRPAHVLYYGATCSGDRQPRLFRMTDAPTATTAQEVSIPPSAMPTGAPLGGAYVHRIAVNPNDADEILVVHSNYNVIGLYHSTDGGASYTAVEGNLQGSEALSGPSLRAAAIVPHPSGVGTTYVVGTSTGVYATRELDGMATTWTQQAASALGNAVVEDLAARSSDGRVAAATHGRGLFVGDAAELPNVLFADFAAEPGPNQMRLRWRTQVERENQGFELQMRATGAPETAWDELAFIEGAGTSESPTFYEYEIDYLLPGTYQFRLRQISLDGSVRVVEPDEFEATIRVEGTHQLTPAYPNPSSQQARFALSVSERQAVHVALYDVQGRRVQVLFDGTLPRDNARTFAVETSRLASGLYFIRATGESFADTERLTVVR